jgi:hypothetical protein
MKFESGDLVHITAIGYKKGIGIVTKVVSFEKAEQKSLVWCLWESGRVNYIFESHIEKLY